MGTSEVELRHEADAQRARMSDTLEAIGDRVSPERMVERRKAAIGNGVKNARNAIMGSRDYEEPRIAQARDKAGDAMRTATDRVQHAPEMVAEQARGNPLAAGLVVFGAGLLIATMFPETDTEQNVVAAAQPQIQHATEQLREAGTEVAHDAQQHGQDAAAELRAVGTDAVAAVKEQAQTSAAQVKGDLKNS